MYLQKIIDYKKQELESQKRKISFQDVRKKASDQAPARAFLSALEMKGIRIIAEVKKASPSAGVIRPDFDFLSIAQDYEENGAACLSVLTDEHFFQGSLEIFGKIREKIKIPMLRKDFTVDEYHLYEARAAGADAILLIVRVLDDIQLKDYQALAHELGMAALIEVHDVPEMERALSIGTQLLGVNNRNLETFKVSLKTTMDISHHITERIREESKPFLVSESGISTPENILELRKAGAGAFLIGESFMRSPSPGRALSQIVSSASA